jgi:hypothetical protein
LFNLLNIKTMKKLLLCGIAILFSLGLSNAQGWETTGAHDDFATTTPYANGANGEGLYWFDLTGGDTIALTRNTGSMAVAVTTAGACNWSTTGTPGMCYPIFGVNFGNDGATPTPNPYVINLTSGANITLDIENTHATQMVFMSIQLEDVTGKKSDMEPNVSDVPVPGVWGTDAQRKALNGLTLAAGERKTIVIDLSSVPGAIGGLTAGAYTCGGPGNCPVTSYVLDPSQIKTVMFQVNFGKDDINLSEAAPHTAETFISGAAIAAYTGTINVHDFKIGSITTGMNESAVVDASLKVYPNPANEALTVSFKSNDGADVSITDIIGTKVFSTTASAGENEIKVNTSNLSSGIYILNIATENGMIARKVTIK